MKRSFYVGRVEEYLRILWSNGIKPRPEMIGDWNYVSFGYEDEDVQSAKLRPAIGHFLNLNVTGVKGLPIETIVAVPYMGLCHKYLPLLPGDVCPEHHHQRKQGFFQVLSGEVWFFLHGLEKPEELPCRVPENQEQFFTVRTGRVLREGDPPLLVPLGKGHWFSAPPQGGPAVLQEFSTYDDVSDNVFTDPAISRFVRSFVEDLGPDWKSALLRNAV